MKNKQEWDIITQITKNTQAEENRRNIGNSQRHNERIEFLNKIEEAIPQEQKVLQDKIQELMEIEQADELQIVNLYINNIAI